MSESHEEAPRTTRPGARRNARTRGSVLLKVARGVVPVAVLALVAVLIFFRGDVVGDPESEPDAPSSSESAEPEPGEEPAEVPAEEREAARAALEVLQAWSRPDLPYERWWRGLRPRLTPGGQEAYAFTDPAQLPDLGELTVAEVTVHATGSAATVFATTAAGERYGVDLSRRADADWLAQRVVFPGGESMYG